jgi:hypothetical protein
MPKEKKEHKPTDCWFRCPTCGQEYRGKIKDLPVSKSHPEPPKEGWEEIKEKITNLESKEYKKGFIAGSIQYKRYFDDYLSQSISKAVLEERGKLWNQIVQFGITREVWDTEMKDYDMKDIVLLKDIEEFFRLS